MFCGPKREDSSNSSDELDLLRYEVEINLKYDKEYLAYNYFIIL